jgi:hypothetical protein
MSRGKRLRVGMEQTMNDIYEVASFVGMPGDKVEPFIAVLEMCGYRIVDAAGRGLSEAPPVTELTACGSTGAGGAHQQRGSATTD